MKSLAVILVKGTEWKTFQTVTTCSTYVIIKENKT